LSDTNAAFNQPNVLPPQSRKTSANIKKFNPQRTLVARRGSQ
jgi:hypothetical protein